tara:strand:+ start:1721 stop:2068 length:348 start_codon:yes stop_codon:yes gene_type:complete
MFDHKKEIKNRYIESNTNIYLKLKRYKELIDSNDLLTNELRDTFEKEYEILLRKYLDNSVSMNRSTNTESTYRRLERRISSNNKYYIGAEYEFPMSDNSTYTEPSPAERAEYEFD